jgi:hypothetical protein
MLIEDAELAAEDGALPTLAVDDTWEELLPQ